MFFPSYVCYAFVCVCLYVPCGHLLGKGWPLGFRLLCLTVSLSLFHWYPGSGLWYLIVSIPDLCTLTYFNCHLINQQWQFNKKPTTQKKTAYVSYEALHMLHYRFLLKGDQLLFLPQKHCAAKWNNKSWGSRVKQAFCIFQKMADHSSACIFSHSNQDLIIVFKTIQFSMDLSADSGSSDQTACAVWLELPLTAPAIRNRFSRHSELRCQVN